ncbi:MAG TPA: hypothetical protein VL475_11575 [Planctomycetaceae bacterium]|jgi:hypothetical protein|nr:hypothetical protein [Planctomycetaceae bacterium]
MSHRQSLCGVVVTLLALGSGGCGASAPEPEKISDVFGSGQPAQSPPAAPPPLRTPPPQTPPPRQLPASSELPSASPPKAQTAALPTEEITETAKVQVPPATPPETTSAPPVAESFIAGKPIPFKAMRQVQGKWSMSDDQLKSPGDSLALLQLTRPQADEYVVTCHARRVGGMGPLIFGLIVDGRQVLLALDAHGGMFSGLEYLDGKYLHANETTYRGSVFAPNRESSVVCTVRKDSVECTVDGKSIIAWQGDQTRLSLPDSYKVPDKQALFLATLKTRFAVRELAITALAEAGSGRN